MVIRTKGDPATWVPVNTATRLMLMLMDGKPHRLDEFWDYLCEAIEPQMAIRAYLQRAENNAGGTASRESVIRENTNLAISEGYRIKVLQTIHALRKVGDITIDIPEVDNWERGGTPRTDPRQALARITDSGFQRIMGSTKRASICKELLSGLARKRLGINLTYLGKPQ
jgi:hypothetical protein